MAAHVMKVGGRIGPYELLTPIGAGGMGEVWKARDTRLDRIVAIKFSHAQFTERFDREARAIAALNHPNIAQIYDVGDAYLVMEYVDGAPVAGTGSTWRTVEIVAQIADGLATAHAAGIVHLDLKPDNILVTNGGIPKILDFGIARRVASDSPQDDRTRTVSSTDPGTVIGTVAYMSPEQVRGEAIDHRSDIFSLGLILYELLSGSRPFLRDTAVETMHAVLKEDAPELPESTPPPLRRIVLHALEKHPDRRFQSARDFAFALRVSGQTTGVAPISVPTAVARRSWLLGGAGAAASAISGGAGFWLARRGGASSHPRYRKLTLRDGLVRTGRFTNNGGIVYAALRAGEVRLHYLAPGDAVPREFAIDGLLDLASVSSRNELAVILNRDRTLARLPLEGGAPRELLTGVVHADWGPDGDTLAVVQDVGDKATIQYPIGNVLAQRGGGYVTTYSVRVSPSGDLVAYTGTGSGIFRGSSFEVATLDQRGKKAVLASFATQGHNFSSCCWTPDGSEIWFESPHGSEPGVIYTVDLNGRRRVVASLPGMFIPQSIGGERRVLLREQHMQSRLRGRSAGLAEQDLSWGGRTVSVALSHDAAFFVFLQYNEKQVSYLRRFDGSAAVRLGDGGPISISPDGKWVQLFRTASAMRSVLVPTGPGQERPFAVDKAFGQVGSIMGWLPDEQYLVLAREDGKPRRFYIWDARNRTLKPIGPDRAFDGYANARTAPGGLRCVARGIDGVWSVISAHNGEEKRIRLAGNQHVAGFTADERALWIASAQSEQDGDRSVRIDRHDIASGQATKAFVLNAPGGASIAPADVCISGDGKSHVYIHRTVASDLHLAEGLA